MELKVIDNLNDFHKLEQEWNELLKYSYTNTFFQKHEWVYNWAKHFLGKNKLLVLLVFHNENIVGIAPLFIENKKLRFLGDPLSDYNDFIIHDKYRKNALDLIFSYLSENKNKWNNAHLMEIPEKSYTLNYLKGKKKTVISKIAETYSFISDSNNITKSLEEFNDKEKEIIRKRRKLKQFLKSDECDFDIADNYSLFKKYLDVIKKFHISRWKNTSTPSYFLKKEYNDFFNEIYEILFNKNLISLSVVKKSNEIISAEICYTYNYTFYSYTKAYNNEYFSISPGNANSINLIKHFIKTGNKEFDFTRGDQDYKKLYSNSSSANYEVEIYNKNFVLKKFYKKTIQKLRKNKKLYRKVMELKEKIRVILKKS